MDQAVLAEQAKVSRKVIADFEACHSIPDAAALAAIGAALEKFGVVFIPENGGGAGVRLKFTAQAAKRIDVLENEGGIVGDDDIL